MDSDEGKRTVNFVGYSLFSGEVDDVVRKAEGWIDERAGHPRVVACLNPHSVVTACDDSEFHDALDSADILVADGVGVSLIAGAIKRRPVSRTTGSDLFAKICARLDARGGSCFLLGSATATLEKMKERLGSEFPNMSVCGLYSPPFAQRFSDDENHEMLEAVRRANPDVLWVAMTAPRQEKWVQAHRDSLSAPVIASVGAVFDFYAGTVKRPHPLLRRVGMEWLGRLASEPGRLWRRTAVSAPRYGALLCRHTLGGAVDRLKSNR